MKIRFVRHGETDLNKPIRRMQGISNYDLNENGIMAKCPPVWTFSTAPSPAVCKL